MQTYIGAAWPTSRQRALSTQGVNGSQLAPFAGACAHAPHEPAPCARLQYRFWPHSAVKKQGWFACCVPARIRSQGLPSERPVMQSALASSLTHAVFWISLYMMRPAEMTGARSSYAEAIASVVSVRHCASSMALAS